MSACSVARWWLDGWMDWLMGRCGGRHSVEFIIITSTDEHNHITPRTRSVDYTTEWWASEHPTGKCRDIATGVRGAIRGRGAGALEVLNPLSSVAYWGSSAVTTNDIPRQVWIKWRRPDRSHPDSIILRSECLKIWIVALLDRCIPLLIVLAWGQCCLNKFTKHGNPRIHPK